MIDRLLNLAAEVDKKANVKAVFGEPQTVNGRTIIPVAEVGYRYRLGRWERGTGAMPADAPPAAAEGPRSGEGERGAVGMWARPIGVVEVTDQGVRLVAVADPRPIVLTGMALAAWAIFLISRVLRRCL